MPATSRRKIPLAPPVPYQGGKRNFAAAISAWLLASKPKEVLDLCCGSGAVSIAVVQRGFDPKNLTMVDAGPWGDFWSAVGEGRLDLDRISSLMFKECPRDFRAIPEWLEKEVALLPQSPETFLVLQGCSFGALLVWWEGEKCMAGQARFRAWPTVFRPDNPNKTKWRRPLADREMIWARLGAVTRLMKGVNGHRADVNGEAFLRPRPNTVWYIDPPYEKTEGYGPSKLDIPAFVARCPRPLFVSEQRQVEGATKCAALGRRGSTVSKGPANRSVEWLSIFEAKNG